ncbi:MAG: glycosyltransferase family 2 protein [Syntrophorhabdaceae bacterium]
MPRVSVVIPNLNGKQLLPMCLNALREQTFTDFEVIVVDNGSRDGSINLLKEIYPEVRTISLDRNYGFAYPVNRGIEAAKGEFICLLNNDIELDPRWMEELLAALETHTDAGSAGPKLMRYHERERINVLAIRVNRDGHVEIVGAGERDNGQYNDQHFVFGVNAGASMYRKAMFDDIGLFDEVFFASFEDVDIAFRAQLAGYKALYVPRSIGYHMVGATIKKKRYRPTYLNNRNTTLFFWKNMPGELIRKNLRTIMGKKSGTFVKRVLTNFWKLRTLYYLRGTVAGYLCMPHVMKERKQIQDSRRVSPEYIESILDRDFI